MITGEQGQQLGDEVWREMIEVFEQEDPGIKGILSAA